MAQPNSKDQQHPQWQSDRQLLNALLSDSPTDRNLSELARLRIRYQNFPGARDIQTDLDRLLELWDLTEASLFEKTRAIHSTQKIYQGLGKQRDDWS